MPVDAQTLAPKTSLFSRSMGASWMPELFGYGLASGLALLADMGTLAALVTQAHWPYLAAASLSFIAGAAVAYLLSVRFVFRHRHIERRTVEFSSFVGLGLVGLVVNAAVLLVAVSGAGIALIPAKVLAAGATFTTNFALRRQMLFAPPGLQR
jgi:putative flippase GtrA